MQIQSIIDLKMAQPVTVLPWLLTCCPQPDGCLPTGFNGLRRSSQKRLFANWLVVSAVCLAGLSQPKHQPGSQKFGLLLANTFLTNLDDNKQDWGNLSSHDNLVQLCCYEKALLARMFKDQATGCSRPLPKDTPAPAVIPSAGEAVIEKVWRDYVWSRKVHHVHCVYFLQRLVEGCASVESMLMHVNLHLSPTCWTLLPIPQQTATNRAHSLMWIMLKLVKIAPKNV